MRASKEVQVEWKSRGQASSDVRNEFLRKRQCGELPTPSSKDLVCFTVEFQYVRVEHC